MTWVGGLILLIGILGIIGVLVWLASLEYLIVLMGEDDWKELRERCKT